MLFYDGVNEKLNKTARGDPHYAFERFRAIENDMKPSSLMVDALLRYDFVHRAATLFSDSAKHIECKEFSQDQEELQRRAQRMARRYRQNVEFVAKLGKAFEFEAVHFWQPDLFNTNKKLSSQELEILEAIRAVRLRPSFQLSDACIAQQMQGVANHYNISSALDNTEETVFFDFCHVSPAANRVIAKSIVDTLHREGQLDRLMNP